MTQTDCLVDSLAGKLTSYLARCVFLFLFMCSFDCLGVSPLCAYDCLSVCPLRLDNNAHPPVSQHTQHSKMPDIFDTNTLSVHNVGIMISNEMAL